MGFTTRYNKWSKLMPPFNFMQNSLASNQITSIPSEILTLENLIQFDLSKFAVFEPLMEDASNNGASAFVCEI